MSDLPFTLMLVSVRLAEIDLVFESGQVALARTRCRKLREDVEAAAKNVSPNGSYAAEKSHDHPCPVCSAAPAIVGVGVNGKPIFICHNHGEYKA